MPLSLILLTCCSIVGVTGDAAAKARPNIIITIDNHDASALGFAGNDFIETPNIDRLQDEGVCLANYHCASRCGPSRAALLTGRYHIRSGHIQTPDGRNVMGDVTVPTLANLFQNADYKTAQYGKWHVGKNYPYRPEDRGFVEVVTFFQGGLSKTGSQHILRHNGQWEPFEGYRIDVCFSKLRKFITKNYYFAVEFAETGTYVFGSAGDPLKPSQEKSCRGYLKIGDGTYEGTFPMKSQIEAGKKFIKASYDGKTKSPSLTVAKLISQPKGLEPCGS